MRPDVELLFERDEIVRAWVALRGSGFPPETAGKVIDGIDLVLFDAELAGCIDAFAKNYSLKPSTRISLASAGGDLRKIIPQLNPAARPYFEELDNMTTRIIGYLEQAKCLGLM